MTIDRQFKSMRILRGTICVGLTLAVLALTGSAAVRAERRSDPTPKPVVANLSAAAVAEQSREHIAFSSAACKAIQAMRTFIPNSPDCICNACARPVRSTIWI